jgi:hypothetical protein
VKAAKVANEFVAGAEEEVVGVGEEDLNAELFEFPLGNALDGCGGSDGHECRRVKRSVRSDQAAETSAGGIGFEDLKGKTHSQVRAGRGLAEGTGAAHLN